MCCEFIRAQFLGLPKDPDGIMDDDFKEVLKKLIAENQNFRTWCRFGHSILYNLYEVCLKKGATTLKRHVIDLIKIEYYHTLTEERAGILIDVTDIDPELTGIPGPAAPALQEMPEDPKLCEEL